ncbi:Localization factor PodJL [Planctomycetes bacterium Poly30]|uniref:Localization factor PodJL n=1 Tax=Saltatorellus ferox TaxID=2528018 RepID=A0A518EZH1_9BACT|nr:Localization factor PodJL [Planctomycetes bacterium Poly30]
MNAETLLARVRLLAATRDRAEEAEFAEQLQRAELGDTSAIYSVAYMLEHGEGVPRDVHRASVWYGKAAARSDVKAMNNLGVYYGSQGNEVEAARCYQKAAEAGDALAMKNLGWRYFDGTGGPRDLTAAKMWLERAVEIGLIDAQWPLARVLREEDPVGNAFHCARLEREVAEECDDPDPTYGWALRLWKGEGVEADPIAAERWMCTAATRGSEDAKDWLRKYGKSWIPEWHWVPQVSLGPLIFGEPPGHLVDALGLEIEEVDLAFLDEDDEEHPESQGLVSRPYGLELDREYGLLSGVSTRQDADLIIRYRGVDLLGASLEDALGALEADDWKLDSLCVGDADVRAESLGISLDVSYGRVDFVHVFTAWDSEDAFRVDFDG